MFSFVLRPIIIRLTENFSSLNLNETKQRHVWVFWLPSKSVSVTMKYMCLPFWVLMSTSLSQLCYSKTIADYYESRKLVLEYEKSDKTGGMLVLSDKEIKANEILMQYKSKEITQGEEKNNYPPSHHFFHAKYDIEQSNVFKFIQKMPKGAALHLHDSSMVDVWWLIKTATYMDNCYVCQGNDHLRFKFSTDPPAKVKGCEWKQTSDMRKMYNPQQYDTWLYYNMTIIVKDPVAAYPNQDVVWDRFLSCFGASDGLIFYEPVFKAYFNEALQEFYDDNVQYIEFRGLLNSVYSLHEKYDQDWSISTYRNISKQFTKTHPDFSGSKFIFSSARSDGASEIGAQINQSIKFFQKYPDYFIGYDLVGHEDPGHSLKYFIKDLLYPSYSGQRLPYFFHAGETDWEGLAVDDNLIDAMLLNTTRIGHGYAILKHPYVLKMGKMKRITLEICPISNQVLKLVDDLRNHPAAALLANNYPIVISSDDPGLWGARPLSHDFYEAFMGIGGANADLTFLKQLAMNSLIYSAMTEAEKKTALNLWQQKWEKFIDVLLLSY